MSTSGQPIPPSQPIVPRNGFGITALCLAIPSILFGITSLVLALFDIMFYGIVAGLGALSIILGVLALIFGILGVSRAHGGTATNGTMSGVGSTIGGAALAFGAVGVVLFAMAFNEAGRDVATLSQPRQPSQPAPVQPYVVPAPPPTPPPQETYPAPPPTVSVEQPGVVVQEFYSYINAGMYNAAYSLGTPEVFGDYEGFTAGYETTSFVTVSVDDVSGNVATVSIIAEQTDGTVKEYSGTYTIDGGQIVSADIAEL